jgi:hypothetical protein
MTLPTSGLITVNDRGARAATTFGSVAAVGGNMVFIKKLTASSDGDLTFHNGVSSVVLDSTYKEYMFTFKDIHPSENTNLTFQGNAVGGSGFNETMTTTFFNAYHRENGSDGTLAYRTDKDQAQGTGFQIISADTQDASASDTCAAGYLHLFNPSSTTFVKHYVSRTAVLNGDYMGDSYSAGYFNTTSAIDEIQFKMNSGNIDTGDICLYGIL